MFARKFTVMVVALLVNACQSGPREPTGQPAPVHAERPIEPYETVLNVPSFFPKTIVSVKRRDPQNLETIDTIQISDPGGVLIAKTSHITGSERWLPMPQVSDEQAFVLRATEWLHSIDEIRTIHHSNYAVGFVASGKGKNKPLPCVYALAAYRLLGAQTHFRLGSFDTGIEAYYCGTAIDPSRFDRMVSEVSIVQDRGAYRAVLEAQKR